MQRTHKKRDLKYHTTYNIKNMKYAKLGKKKKQTYFSDAA